MISAHFIIHEIYEGPGAYSDWINKNSITTTYTRLYLGEKLPESIKNIDLLVVLGGPQSPNTTVKECSYFDAKKEIDFIHKFITSNKIVIGVCLGAQLIGEAYNTAFAKSPEPEIGNFEISMTQDGLDSKLFSHFPKKLIVGHWHNDMPGLTNQSKIIAYNKACPRQIVEYSKFVYGFQCHMEFNSKSIVTMIKYSNEELNSMKNNLYVQSRDNILNFDYSNMNKLLYQFLDKLVLKYLNK